MKFENTRVYGIDTAVRSMRMPLQSFDKADSEWVYDEVIPPITTDEYQKSFQIGEKDLDLAHRLLSTGTDSDSKFLRSISVYTELTAPTYFTNELHTYKIGTVSNSSSLQHKGASRDFTIRDFASDIDEIYDLLDPQEERNFKEENPRIIPYETEEFKIFKSPDTGREYKIYRNGKIVACPFSYTDTFKSGRVRHYPEKEVMPYQVNGGYWAVRIDGRLNKHYLVHRLVAITWFGDKSFEGLEINHKNKHRGDNSVENLEWITHQENEIHKLESYTPSLLTRYKAHCNSTKFDNSIADSIKTDKETMSFSQISQKYGMSISTAEKLCYGYPNKSEYSELFDICDCWKGIIDTINSLRKLYKETNDYHYFRLMRQMMPMGYEYTISWTANYQVLRTIYFQRRNHRLKEWTDVFIPWIESLPYAKDLITYEGGNK